MGDTAWSRLPCTTDRHRPLRQRRHPHRDPGLPGAHRSPGAVRDGGAPTALGTGTTAGGTGCAEAGVRGRMGGGGGGVPGQGAGDGDHGRRGGGAGAGRCPCPRRRRRHARPCPRLPGCGALQGGVPAAPARSRRTPPHKSRGGGTLRLLGSARLGAAPTAA